MNLYCLPSLSLRKAFAALLLALLLGTAGFMPRPANAATEAEISAWIEQLINIVQQLRNQLNNLPPAPEGATNVFSEPVVKESTNDSIKLLQQVLATDPSIYPDGYVTGFFGPLTEVALNNFQTSFGLSVTGTFTPETNAVLTATLEAIPLTEYPDTYLLIDEVKARIVAERDAYTAANQPVVGEQPVDDGKPTSIMAIRDYLTNDTKVHVLYHGGELITFTIVPVEPQSMVAEAIASEIELGVEEIESLILYRETNGDLLKEVILKVYLDNDMEIDVEYLDGTTEFFDVTPEEIESFVEFAYGGDYAAYDRDFDEYVEKARDGEPIPEVYELVADQLGRPVDEVEAVLVIDVDEYSDDPCYEGRTYICGGA
jgi:peptidoglycan hydrolase-like protein with peptidoglycan-binding domain